MRLQAYAASVHYVLTLARANSPLKNPFFETGDEIRDILWPQRILIVRVQTFIRRLKSAAGLVYHSLRDGELFLPFSQKAHLQGLLFILPPSLTSELSYSLDLRLDFCHVLTILGYCLFQSLPELLGIVLLMVQVLLLTE